jgi:hypothetical protein
LKIIPITKYQQIAGGKIDNSWVSEGLEEKMNTCFGRLPSLSLEEQLASCHFVANHLLMKKDEHIRLAQDIREKEKPIQAWMEKIRSGQAYNMKFSDVL